MNQPRKATLTAQALADEHAQMLHTQNQCLRRQLSHERCTLRQTRAAMHRMTWLVQLSEREADQRVRGCVMLLNGRTTHIAIAGLLQLFLEDGTVWYLHNDHWCYSSYKAADLSDSQRFITVDDADCEPVCGGVA